MSICEGRSLDTSKRQSDAPDWPSKVSQAPSCGGNAAATYAWLQA